MEGYFAAVNIKVAFFTRRNPGLYYLPRAFPPEASESFTIFLERSRRGDAGFSGEDEAAEEI